MAKRKATPPSVNKVATKKVATKKVAAKKVAAKKGTIHSIGAGPGPVSLEEARKLVSPPAPKRSPRRGATPSSASQSSALEATPAEVGKERDDLNKKYRKQNDRRIREYKALMTLMKQRGVKKSSAAKKGPPKRRALGAPQGLAASVSPLQVFAEGDSWFDYPVPLFGGGVIPRLEDLLGVPILNLAKAGDEVRVMLGVVERQIIETQFRNGSPAGGAWDAMLFSGGGNDIVGNPMALWIRDFDPSVPLASLVHSARFDTALAMVRAGYEDLITMRDKLSPSTHLVFHAYDFAIPDGRGVCFMGPWMKPAFDVRKFTNQSSAFEVVKVMLKRFAAMLDTLAQSNANVTLINAQGTLSPQPSSWHNELHPSKEGFQTMAKIFRDKLKQLFPAKVP